MISFLMKLGLIKLVFPLICSGSDGYDVDTDEDVSFYCFVLFILNEDYFSLLKTFWC